MVFDFFYNVGECVLGVGFVVGVGFRFWVGLKEVGFGDLLEILRWLWGLGGIVKVEGLGFDNSGI